MDSNGRAPQPPSNQPPTRGTYAAARHRAALTQSYNAELVSANIRSTKSARRGAKAGLPLLNLSKVRQNWESEHKSETSNPFRVQQYLSARNKLDGSADDHSGMNGGAPLAGIPSSGGSGQGASSNGTANAMATATNTPVLREVGSLAGVGSDASGPQTTRGPRAAREYDVAKVNPATNRIRNEANTAPVLAGTSGAGGGSGKYAAGAYSGSGGVAYGSSNNGSASLLADGATGGGSANGGPRRRIDAVPYGGAGVGVGASATATTGSGGGGGVNGYPDAGGVGGDAAADGNGTGGAAVPETESSTWSSGHQQRSNRVGHGQNGQGQQQQPQQDRQQQHDTQPSGGPGEAGNASGSAPGVGETSGSAPVGEAGAAAPAAGGAGGDGGPGASGTNAMSPAQALRRHMNQLTPYEQAEVLEYSQIYFLGPSAKKVRATPGAPQNSGYDDSKGDYTVVMHDHISYRFEILEVLGKGSFGQVVKVFDYKTNSMVALKIIRNKKQFHHQALVEVKILERIRDLDADDTSAIIHLYEYFKFRNHLCITFELLSVNLYEFIKLNDFQGFSLGLIRRFAIQILHSLRFLRKHRIIHCDLKPENILLKHPAKSGIKVIDLGSSCFENERVYTYIQSRFYRSPEVILGMSYGTHIDMWSFGCVLAELYTGFPLFAGEDEVEQLLRIQEVFGPPPRRMVETAKRRKEFFDSKGNPKIVPNSRGKRRIPGSKDLARVLRCDDPLFVSFIAACLRWDPDTRLTPDEGLQHAWVVQATVPIRTPGHLTERRRRASGRRLANITSGGGGSSGGGASSGTSSARRRAGGQGSSKTSGGGGGGPARLPAIAHAQPPSKPPSAYSNNRVSYRRTTRQSGF